MNLYWIILIILTIIIAVFLIFLFIMKKKKKQKTSPYEEALISLIDGEEEYAMKKFQETVFNNSDNVEAYVRLAELLRRRNEPLKALQIHRYLLARKGLDKKTINKILFQTARDYLTLKAYQKAIDTMKRLLKSESHNEQYCKFMLLTYEESSLWNEAVETFTRMAKTFDYPQEYLLNYEVYAAYESYKNGDNEWAAKMLNRVLKIEPDNVPALIYTGDIEYSKGNIEEAIKRYTRVIDIDTKSVYIVFPRLTKPLFEKGEFQKIETIYKNFLEKYPEDNKTTFLLADYCMKMGRTKEANELLKNGVETFPDSIRMNLLLLLTELEMEKSSSVTVLNHIIDIFKKKEIFKCKKCGHISQEYLIRCPECREWKTYEMVWEI